MKQKVQLEYLLGTASVWVVWNALATNGGLQRWFAHRIEVDGNTWHFSWGKTEQRSAKLLRLKDGSHIRFQWIDDEEHTFFEFRLLHNELTSDYLLRITDFSDEGETEDIKDLWASQLENLTRTFGVRLQEC